MINEIYAIKAVTNLVNLPFSLYLLNEIKVTAITNKIMPPNDTHIFVIALIVHSPLIFYSSNHVSAIIAYDIFGKKRNALHSSR